VNTQKWQKHTLSQWHSVRHSTGRQPRKAKRHEQHRPRRRVRSGGRRFMRKERIGIGIGVFKPSWYAWMSWIEWRNRGTIQARQTRLLEKTNQSLGSARWLLNWLVPPAGVVSALWTLMSRNWFSRLEGICVCLYYYLNKAVYLLCCLAQCPIWLCLELQSSLYENLPRHRMLSDIHSQDLIS